MEGATRGSFQVISRRTVRPSTPPLKEEEVEVIHLTPLDLRLIRTDYIQKGILLPTPPSSGASLINALESSFALALRRFYPLAGRLAADERRDGTVTVSLRCTGEGAEFVHAVAPELSAADIVSSSLYTPPVVREELHSFDPALSAGGADVALVSVQVTELADGVFVGVTLCHAVADGAALWYFLNTWSEIHRCGVVGGDINDDELSTPAPVFRRPWFSETWPVPIPLPFAKLERIPRQLEQTTIKECFLTFSGESVRNLTARANAEVAGTATITSLQVTMAHLWRAVSRARRLPRDHRTSYSVVVDCRGHVKGMPRVYVGNATAFGKAEATAGEVEGKGLGWTAWQLSIAEAAAFDEARIQEGMERWARRPEFVFMSSLASAGTAALATGSSSWSEVFGNNDFGWGMPVAVRSGAGNKADGKAAVFETPPERGGGWYVELCLAPDALARLVADEEFMDAVSLPAGVS